MVNLDAKKQQYVRSFQTVIVLSHKGAFKYYVIRFSQILDPPLGGPLFAKSSKIPIFCIFSHYIDFYWTPGKKSGSWDKYKGCLKGQTFYKGIGSKIQRKIWQLGFLHFMLQI